MEKYYKIINNILLCLGFDNFGNYQNNPKVLIVLTAIKYLNLAVMSTFLVLIWIYISTTDFSFTTLPDLLNGIYGIHVMIKFLFLVFEGPKIGEFMQTLMKYHQTNFGYRGSDSKFFSLVPKMAIGLSTISVTIVLIVQSFSFLLVIVTLVVNQNQSSIEKIVGDPLRMKLAFTFQPNEHLLFVFLCQFYFAMLLQFVSVTFELIICLAITYLAECFNRLGEEIKIAFDENPGDFKEKLKRVVDIHCDLINHSVSMNNLFRVPILSVALIVSVAMCILGMLVADVSLISRFVEFISNFIHFQES